MRDDRTYFMKRAEAQVEFARAAACENAARAHFHLAGLYWDRAYNPAMQPAARPTSTSISSPPLAYLLATGT
jgi:hypothetical protein